MTPRTWWTSCREATSGGFWDLKKEWVEIRIKRKVVDFWSHRGETSRGLQNVPRVCSRNCVSLYSCRKNRLIGLVGTVFANDPEDLGSIPGSFIPKTLKMVLDTSFLNIQQYKVRIKGKVEQSRERSSALPYTEV